MHSYTKKELMTLITGKLRRNFGRDVEEATSLHMFKACAMVLRDIISERQMKAEDKAVKTHQRQVHYLSLEFLMGRSLMKNAYNLGVLEPLKEAIEGLGFSAPDLFETEPDAGLGNGGLGRLAACYLDSMTTLEIPATGYSICYELGIFKQKIVDGQQVELPDNWLGLGDAWLIPKMDETEEVRFGGKRGGRVGRAGPPPCQAHRLRHGAGRSQGYGDRRLRHRARQHSCACGTPRAPRRWTCHLFSSRPIPEGRGAAGHGRDHLQGALSRGQPL